MKKENIIIIILSLLLIIMSIITVFALKDNGSNIIETKQEESINDEDNNNESQFITNATIEKYLGKWYLGSNDKETYSNIEIKKTTTGYTMNILVNKDANYANLELNCASNSGVCYATGDDSHHFAIVMANNMIMVIPDYAMPGTEWTFGSEE